MLLSGLVALALATIPPVGVVPIDPAAPPAREPVEPAGRVESGRHRSGVRAVGIRGARQEAAARVFDGLEGEWRGEGTLLGRPARFTMRWTRVLEGRFARLEFANAFAGGDGTEATPVLSAVAHYPLHGPAPRNGWWFDSRGERISLEVSPTDSSLLVDWASHTERGRTVYHPLGDSIVVVDSVLAEGGYREFGRATYRRRGPGARPASTGWAETEDGARLHYRIVGEGDEAVIVPMESLLSDALAPLADGRRLVLYDPLGRGESEPTPLEALTEDRQIRDLEALRAHLALDRVALLGWSGLGKLVARYAIAHPERVTRLVLVSPVPPSSDEYALDPDVPSRDEKLDVEALEAVRARHAAGEFAADSAGYCRAERSLTLPTSFVDPDLAALVPDVCRHRNEWPDLLYPYFGALLGSFGEFDHRADFRALDTPKLVVHGRQDGIPLAGGRAWVADDPGGRLLVLSPAGHFPFLERPVAFLDAVDTFLGGAWPEGAEPVTSPGSS